MLPDQIVNGEHQTTNDRLFANVHRVVERGLSIRERYFAACLKLSRQWSIPPVTFGSTH